MTTTGTIEEVGPFIVVKGYDDALALWSALLAHYLAERETKATTWGLFYPETTVGDVFTVAALFDERLAKARPDQLGLDTTRANWTAYRDEMRRLTAGKLLHETYPDNARFWRAATRRLAVDLSAGAALPHKTTVMLDALKTGIDAAGVGDLSLDGVLGTGGRLLEQSVDAVGGALKTVGSGAKDIVKGGVEGVGDAVIKPLVDIIGKPFLIGAAVLGGLLIAPRVLDGGRRHG